NNDPSRFSLSFDRPPQRHIVSISCLQNPPSQTRRKPTVGRALAGGISADAMRRKNFTSPFETVTTVLLRHASSGRWPISSVASAAPGGIITPLCTTPDSTISPTFLWDILFDSRP